MDNSKKSVINLLYLFLLSTTLNHEFFFIDIGSFSLRPYMLVVFFGYFYLLVSKFNIYLTRSQVFLILGLLAFLTTGISTGLLSPYISSYSQLFVRNLILLTFQIFTLIFLLLLYNHTNKEMVSTTFKNVLILMLFTSFLLYFYQISVNGFTNYNIAHLGILYSYQGRPRMTGTVGDPNYFTLYISIYFWIYNYLSKNSILFSEKALGIFFIGAILLSQSRTAILINGSGLIIMFLFEREVSLKTRIIDTIRLLCITIPILYFFNRYVIDLRNLLALSNDASFNQRYTLLVEGLNNIYRHPFGVGLGYVQNYYMEYIGFSKVAHNDFITVFIETGLLGVTMYILLFSYTYLSINKKGKYVVFVLIGYSLALTMYYFDPIIPILFATLLMRFHNIP